MNGKVLAALAAVVVIAVAAVGVYYLLGDEGEGPDTPGPTGSMLLPGSKVTYHIPGTSTGLPDDVTYTIVGWKDDVYYMDLDFGSYPDINYMLSYPEVTQGAPDNLKVEDTTVDVPRVGEVDAVRVTAGNEYMTVDIVYLSGMGYLLYSGLIVQEGFGTEEVTLTSCQPVPRRRLPVLPRSGRVRIRPLRGRRVPGAGGPRSRSDGVHRLRAGPEPGPDRIWREGRQPDHRRRRLHGRTRL